MAPKLFLRALPPQFLTYGHVCLASQNGAKDVSRKISMHDWRLPSSTTAWGLSYGKMGDETQCFGIAEALGLAAQRRLVAPRRLYALFMPFGPIDPHEQPDQPGSPIAPPYPDIAIAAGRRTVAYLRRLKRDSGGRTF